MVKKVIRPILLAAGQSQRFGSDKLLHSVHYHNVNKPMILHSLKPWLDVFEHVNIVVRADNHALIQMLEDSEFSSRLTLLMATNATLGMSASLVAGIVANIDADGWLIGLADMPFIQSSVIVSALDALRSGAMITIPTFNGQRGHPVGFASHFRSQLLALTGDKGAKQIITASPYPITFINSPDSGILKDIDTRESLAD